MDVLAAMAVQVSEVPAWVLATGAAILAVERVLYAWERLRGRNQR